MKSVRRIAGALFVLFSLSSAAAFAAPQDPVRLAAAAEGQVIDAPGTDVRAEVVTFGEDLAPALLRAALEETVLVAGWPIAPGVRADVRITRFEIYAPDARIWKVEGNRQTEVPRSRMVFFRGLAEDDPDLRIFVAVDPGTGAFQGLAVSPEGTYEIRPFPKAAGGRSHLVTVPEYFLPEYFLRDDGEAERLSWTCGQSGAPLDFLQEKPTGAPSAGESADFPLDRAIGSLHSVTVAVDTDNELLLQKFADDTTNATNYVAALIAALNVIYERDLNIRLLQGTTFLRVSTTPDPYTVTGSGASFAQLNEFSNYWSINNGAIQRGLAMLLSGKSANNNSSSGIAWVPGLCSTSTGYSFSQVFKFAGSTGASDAFVVGHELGHNFGSPHTHCYSPTIDNCYNLEAGCYAGATSCPAATTINGVPNVRGTLMSYCHILGGCAAANVFHSRTVDLITNIITPRIGVCVFPVITPPLPTVSSLFPTVGTTAGGTAVTITGASFVNGATVSFGGTSVAVTFNSPTQLTVTTPAHATGPVSVVVTNPDTGAGTKTNAFFYTPPPTATDFFTLTPCRVLDTRNANGPTGGPVMGASAERSFPVAGSCGVPVNAKAVVVNMTVISPTAGGYLSIDPGNAFPLGTAAMTFQTAEILSNNATLLLATDGTGTIRILNGASGTTHVAVDVTGYYAE